MRPVDEGELAAIFRGIEKSRKVEVATLGIAGRLAGFGEIELGLTADEADRESRRCLSCGCRAATGCKVRRYSAEYEVEPYRFAGVRRRFEQDDSHPEIIYEPGKCIMCGACVEVTSETGEVLGLEIVGRGFEVTVQVPFDEPLSEGLRRAARRCAEVCPTGALALRTARSCDLGTCGVSPPPAEPPLVTLGRRI
jgi:ferredoxin